MPLVNNYKLLNFITFLYLFIKLQLSVLGKVNENYKVINSSDDPWRFVWIVDFPLFKMENNSIQSVHHPFTQPQTKITPSNLLEVCLTKIL